MASLVIPASSAHVGIALRHDAHLKTLLRCLGLSPVSCFYVKGRFGPAACGLKADSRRFRQVRGSAGHPGLVSIMWLFRDC